MPRYGLVTLTVTQEERMFYMERTRATNKKNSNNEVLPDRLTGRGPRFQRNQLKPQ